MSEWIKCSDRLPDTIGSFLCFKDSKIYFVFFNSNKNWCFENEYLQDVTHWMPLPESPTQRNATRASQ